MLLLILSVFYIGGISVPLSVNEYSPPAAYFGRAPDNKIHVYGDVLYENNSAAAGIEVRLFATDELIEDYVITDINGRFFSSVAFNSGQLITVSYNGVRLSERGLFIDYNASPNIDYYMGTFVVPDF
jgi:hypothetical protein